MALKFAAMGATAILFLCVAAEARACARYVNASQNAVVSLETYGKRAAAGRSSLIAGNGFSNLNDSRNCSRLSQLYQTAQKALNSANEARSNLNNALKSCGPDLASSFNDGMRLAQNASDYLRADLKTLSAIASANGCRVY